MKISKFWLQIFSALVLYSGSVSAQLIPDSSTVSTVSSNGIHGLRIDGGVRSGNNLFHSFKEFNVGVVGSVYFSNPSGVNNILTRVTGLSPSKILGTLGVLGNANLFLMNPNGIIFGKDAKLDINGSFIATTASSIDFIDGTQFIAKKTLKPILTVSVPVGLGFSGNPGSIIVQGSGTQIPDTFSIEGLSIQQSKTIGLVGGDVIFNGGIITTAGGRIELGSVRSGTLLLINNEHGLSFNYDRVNSFGNINLENQSTLDASGNGGGDIHISGNNINISENSQILINTFGALNHGEISIFANESLELVVNLLDQNYPTGLFIVVNKDATGNGGNLTIRTGQLILTNGALISSSTLGSGNGGNINIDSDSVMVKGTSLSGFPSSISVTAEPGSTGNGGSIVLNTNYLSIIRGGVISSATFGKGKAGDLLIKSTDTIDISGVPQLQGSHLFFGAGQPSRLSTRSTGTGNAGSLLLETKNINIYDGATITATSKGTGNAGILNLNANSINLNNQGSITAATSSSMGGNISLNVQSLQVRNNSNITATAGNSGNGGNIGINANTIVALGNSGILANAYKGRGGNIQINTQGIFISPDTKITASSQLGVNGTVNIRTLGFDLKNIFVPLTPNFITTEQLIAGSCLAHRNVERGRFVITGRGGLAVNPETPLDDNWRLLSEPVSSQVSRVEESAPPPPRLPEPQAWKPGDPIVEAEALVHTADGRILLDKVPPSSPESVEELSCHREPSNGSRENWEQREKVRGRSTALIHGNLSIR